MSFVDYEPFDRDDDNELRDQFHKLGEYRDGNPDLAVGSTAKLPESGPMSTNSWKANLEQAAYGTERKADAILALDRQFGDLLAALERIKNLLPRQAGRLPYTVETEIIEIARAAIKRAKGV